MLIDFDVLAALLLSIVNKSGNDLTFVTNFCEAKNTVWLKIVATGEAKLFRH